MRGKKKKTNREQNMGKPESMLINPRHSLQEKKNEKTNVLKTIAVLQADKLKK